MNRAAISFATVADAFARARAFAPLARKLPLPAVNDLAAAPPDLRSIDPSFSLELDAGTLHLDSGLVPAADLQLLFDRLPANAHQARELIGFGWLRHLAAARSELAEQQARAILLAWAEAQRAPTQRIDIAETRARRVLSLLSHMDLALQGADTPTFDAIVGAFKQDLAGLARDLTRLPQSAPRLTASVALVAAHLATVTKDAGARESAERLLITALQRQILDDGGHVSRNPATVLALLLDLVPLRRLYLIRDLTAPDALTQAIRRMASFLRALQHPDRSIARFNGMGASPVSEIASVLAEAAPSAAPTGTERLADSGYIRLARGDTVVIADAGATVKTRRRSNGPLAFEFATASGAIVMGCGRPLIGSMSEIALSRRAAAHATLCIEGVSGGVPPLGGVVELQCGEDADVATLVQRGDRIRSQLKHRRILALKADGNRLDGVDSLDCEGRGKTDVAVTLRFHLHPAVFVANDTTGNDLRLTLADGKVWLFMSEDLPISLEPSQSYGMHGKARPSLQIVLAGRSSSVGSIRWSFERMA